MLSCSFARAFGCRGTGKKVMMMPEGPGGGGAEWEGLLSLDTF